MSDGLIKVNGPRLRAIRDQCGLTLEQLAKTSGVSARTIRRLETESCESQLKNVVALAESLHVDMRQIAYQLPPVPVTNTDLERVAAVERAAGPGRVVHDGSGARVLNATALQELYSAAVAHEGAAFYVRGIVESHRPADAREGRVLAALHGMATRFLVVVPAGPKRSLHVTVHTRDAATTAKLLVAWRDQCPAEIVAYVAIAAVKKGRVIADGHGEGAKLTPEEGKWRGFAKFVPKEPQPWTLVAEKVEQSAKE